MSERVQELLYEVQRAAQQEGSALGKRFASANERSLRDLQREIAEEIAFSLGKAGRKIEQSLRILQGILERRATCELSEHELVLLRGAFYEQRTLAERALRDLLIQREALGFRHHEDVKQRYAIPVWSS